MMLETLHQSHIGMFYRCPTQFEFRYVKDLIIPPGIAARIGSGFHKGTEVNHKAKIITHKDEPLSICQDAGRDEYIRLIKEQGVFFPAEEKDTARKQLAEGVDITVDLIKTYHTELAPNILPIMAEKYVIFEDPDISVPLAGTIDVISAGPWLIDLKTAARKWAQDKADTDIQITLYKQMIETETNIAVDKLSFEVFIKAKNGSQHQSLETTRTEKDWVCLKRRIKAMLAMIQAGNFPPCDPGSWICSPKWCGYYQICPYTK